MQCAWVSYMNEQIHIEWNTGIRVSFTEEHRETTHTSLKYAKSLSILSTRYDTNDCNGNLWNPSRVTINSPSIRFI